MNSNLNFKELEKKAFQSTYQDGLWDIYYGLIIIFLAVFMDRPDNGYSWVNLVCMVIGFIIAYSLLKVGKKLITTPRLGSVVFGEIRKQKKRKMGIILGVLIAFQVLLLLPGIIVWLNPQIAINSGLLLAGKSDLLLVSSIAFLIVCTGVSIIAYFSDFIRGYYIAVLMASAVFLMIFLDQPIYPLLLGVLVTIPGIVLLIRFIKRYPLHHEEE